MSDPSNAPPSSDRADAVAAEDEPVSRRTLLAAAAGLVFGLVVVLVLPASWVYVAPEESVAVEQVGAAKYACPMFCVVMDHKPLDGKCPVCGMEMTEVSGELSLDPHEQRMVGLEVGAVARVPLVRSLRLVGEVDFDESRLARVTTRVGGWLRDVHVDTTWTQVAEGEALAGIYAPELYAAEQEYLIARRSADERLVPAARRKLELLGVDDREIDELNARDAPRESVLLRAPYGGVVVERAAVAGAAVRPGAVLYTVADLDRVWVQAQAFEDELPWVRVGQRVRVTAVGVPLPVEGTVAFVDPVIDRTSRAARVRIDVDNAAGADGRRPFRIGQRVDVTLEASVAADGEPTAAADAAAPLSVPRAAVMRTGTRRIVYVLFAERPTAGGVERDYRLDPRALPERVWYEPIQVRVGPTARLAGEGASEDRVPILEVVPPAPLRDPVTGALREVLSLRRLSPGVTIVTSGNLLLDSQAQLAGKPSLLFPEGNRGGSSDPHAGH